MGAAVAFADLGDFRATSFPSVSSSKRQFYLTSQL
jgi:hypothetical protein